MTLNQYLDAAYALLVEEYRRLGANLSEALDRTREFAAGRKVEVVTADGRTETVTQPQNTLTPEELANEQALAALESAMSGVGVGGIR